MSSLNNAPPPKTGFHRWRVSSQRSKKGFGKVQKGGEDLLNDADAIGADGQPIADIVNGLGDRLGS